MAQLLVTSPPFALLTLTTSVPFAELYETTVPFIPMAEFALSTTATVCPAEKPKPVWIINV